ncbi:MAG: radical SAM protein [Candidatus Pacearchaeota archaeon]
MEEAIIIGEKLVKGGVFEVVLTGGELLIRRDIVYPLSSYLSNNNIEVGLNTNLVLLKEEDCEKIKESGITRVFSSLPSFNKETYKK